MNILLLTDDIYPHAGGIERVTDIQVRLFAEHGHTCFVVCRTGKADTPYGGITQIDYSTEQRYRFSSQFVGQLSDQVVRFAESNQIHVVINTRDWPLLSTIANHVARRLNIKQINYIHHQIYDREAIHRYIKATPRSLKRDIKNLFFPLYWLLFRKKISRNYRLLYQQCDVMVILSEGFRRAAQTELATDGGRKITVISNPIVFAPVLDVSAVMREKENRVLIVGRMEEVSKNISGALRIWETIEKRHPELDWELDIVGDGPDKEAYEIWVKKHGLRHVHFCGHIGNLDQLSAYYRRASLFMMTSHFEGFGMTLIEAQSFGCIPLVFDNFAAVHDIIAEDSSNGAIIQSNDYNAYVEQIESLMANASKRQKMGRLAIGSCQIFSRESHYRQWMELFRNLGIVLGE